jgi:hypothetical protein
MHGYPDRNFAAQLVLRAGAGASRVDPIIALRVE